MLIAEYEGGMFRHYRPRYANAPIKVYANGRISDKIGEGMELIRNPRRSTTSAR